MQPDLEVVQIRRGESFKAWAHGYPFHTVRWHFHPEYELHHVVATTRPLLRRRLHRRVRAGQSGAHRTEPAAQLDQRRAARHARAAARPHRPVLRRARRAGDRRLSGACGLRRGSRDKPPRRAVFPRHRQLVGPMLAELVDAQGVRRIALFISILGASEPRAGCALADQRQLSARSVRLHVGRHQRGARLYRQPSDRAVQRRRSCGDRQAKPQRVLAQLPPPHRHVARPIREAAAHQPRLPDC